MLGGCARRELLLVFLLMSHGCSSDTEGEAQRGTLQGEIEGDTFDADFGVAVNTPSNYTPPDGVLLLFSDEPITCDTDPDALPQGYFILAQVPELYSGVAFGGFVNVQKHDGSGQLSLGSEGTILLDSMENGRITGSMDVSSSGMSASGTFDVKRCF